MEDARPVQVRDQRKPGWWWAESEVFKYAKAIRPSGVAVYALLCRFADNRTRKAFPSVQTMADILGVSRDVVMEAIGRLLEQHLIHRERPNRRKVTIYTLLPVVEKFDVENVDVESPEFEVGNDASSKSRISTSYLDSGTRLTELDSLNGEFDQFWTAFPKKHAKLDAQKAWRQTNGSRPSLPAVLAALARDGKTGQWRRGVIPHAGTWLRGARWADETAVPRRREFVRADPEFRANYEADMRRMAAGVGRKMP